MLKLVQQNHFFALEEVIDSQPLTVTYNTPLIEVIRLMQEWGSSCRVADEPTNNLGNSSCVLVVEDSQLTGIFTERDLVTLIAAETDTESVTVAEIMTQNLVTLIPNGTQDIFTVLNILRSHGIRHLPIVDENHNLLGLITAKNLRRKLQPINMMKWRKVKEIMDIEVVYADPDDSVRHLAKLMTKHNSSYVAIAESRLDPQGNSFVHPIGIVTERDIVQFQNLNLDLGQPAQNIMSAPLFLIDPEDTLWSVKQQMEQHRVRRLLVGSERAELLGIVTQTSLLQMFDPSEMYEVIEALQQQVCQLETDKAMLLENRQAKLEQEVRQRTAILKSTKSQLQQQVRQQQTIAELGQFALEEKNLGHILDRAVNLVGSTLKVEYCKVLELLPDGEELLLKAGVGWHEGLVGVATVKANTNSQAGYTLLAPESVVVSNLLTETRFSGPDLLLDHQVISGISISISGDDKPFGILSVHTTQHRNFSQDDVNFIQAVSNIIAQANEHQQSEFALKQSEQKFRAIFDKSFQFIGLLEPNGNLIEANQTALDFVGLTPKDVRGKPFWEMPWWSMSIEIQATIKQAINRAAMGEFIRLEVEHPGVDNRVITVDFSLTPIKDETGKVIMLIPEGRNISELKQTESQLRESQERYTLAVAGSNNGLWDWNVLTDEVFYAPRFKEMIGYADEEMSNTFEAWSTRLHPKDRDRVLAAVQAHLEKRIPYNIEYRLQKKNGEYCWILARGQAIWDKQEQPVRMAGSIDDISDRKRREEILKDIASGVSVEVGENFFQSLVEYLSKTLQVDYAFISKFVQSEGDRVDTLAVYGKGSILTNFAYDLANAPCGNVIGEGLCIYPEAVQELFPNIPPLQTMAAESYAGMPIFDAAGKVLGLIAVVDCKPMGDIALIEEVLKIFATRVTNELERQNAESEIRKQAVLLDVATDAIMVRGLDDKILFWNQGAENIYGWTKTEAINKFGYKLLYRQSPTELGKIQQTVIEQGEWQGELKQVTKAGKYVIVQSRWTLVKDNTGNPQSYLVVKTDITEQKLLEAQFLRTQRLESLGTLAGGIAHDLNNILAPIMGFSKLLPLKLPNVDEQTKGFFKIMENNANRGSALVKQILTFSRGLEGDRGIVQIRHLIAEIGQIITETFPKTIELEINTPKNLWTVNADVNQLHQVLMNLSVNARDAMPDKGTLTIKAENYTVDADYAQLHLDAKEGDYLLITVTDTGIGIPDEIVDRIFEPFFTTKEIGRGTGLGLSTAIGIIKSHDGFVEVMSNSENTKGTQFQVYLPASDTIAATEELAEIPQGNGELVLVVDDESAILEVTKATLETYNYRVLTAKNGVEAIAIYAKNQEEIDLVIMDIMMPTMDGKTAILTLKQIDPDIKVIAVSGLIDRQEIINEVDNNISAYLAKPYTNEDLLIQIDEIVLKNS